MGKSYRSTALVAGKIIDCRSIYLMLDFYQLDTEKACALSGKIIAWVQEFLSDSFIAKWTLDGRSLIPSKSFRQLCDKIPANGKVDVDVSAFAKSAVVYDKESYKRQTKELFYYGVSGDCPQSSISSDYVATWEALLPAGRKEPDKLKVGVLSVFNSPGKYCMAANYSPDMTAAYRVRQYKNIPELFYGSLVFRVSAYCLGEDIQPLSNQCAKFAEALSVEFTNLNARVALQPMQSPYLKYFGAEPFWDGSHEKTPFSAKEWYSSYYMQSLEWFNLISPLTRQLLDRNFSADSPYILCHTLSSSALILQANCNVQEYDIADARRLKEAAYPVLIPGRSVFPLRVIFPREKNSFFYKNNPRSCWEIVSVLEDEVEVYPDYLVFSSLM